ncbi:MAG: 3-oxoacyl-ACP reductase FabG [Bacteroidales bacterium]|jgi:3-oxoacyl-[acyl-carrier protein] reductase|nr:3-oxoacyl-ACP reductase FabG [Bacteroidales bacterium]
MKYALITGGSRGIGQAICLELSKSGYAILINYVSNQTAAENTKKLIEEQGGVAELIPFDVADSKAVDKTITAWMDIHPDDFIAVLVNNAGIRKDALMVFMQDKEWNDIIRTNLDSFFYITRRVLKDMLSKRFGRIINIVSLSGLKGLPGQVNYSASKAGLIGGTKALAQEVAPRKITVNAVAPGFIDTEMIEDMDQTTIKKMIPMRRLGKTEEVAALVGFLASEKAEYITGEVISINGGLYT